MLLEEKKQDGALGSFSLLTRLTGWLGMPAEEDRNKCCEALQSTIIIKEASAQIKGTARVGAFVHPCKRLLREEVSLHQLLNPENLKPC